MPGGGGSKLDGLMLCRMHQWRKACVGGLWSQKKGLIEISMHGANHRSDIRYFSVWFHVCKTLGEESPGSPFTLPPFSTLAAVTSVPNSSIPTSARPGSTLVGLFQLHMRHLYMILLSSDFPRQIDSRDPTSRRPWSCDYQQSWPAVWCAYPHQLSALHDLQTVPSRRQTAAPTSPSVLPNAADLSSFGGPTTGPHARCVSE